MGRVLRQSRRRKTPAMQPVFPLLELFTLFLRLKEEVVVAVLVEEAEDDKNFMFLINGGEL